MENFQFTVLLVEDDLENADLTKTILMLHGFKIEHQPTAQNALDFLNKNSVHAIVSDINLGKMNGVEFYKKIRDQGLNIPFVLMTGYSLNRSWFGADQKYKAAHFFFKPFSVDDLAKHL